MATSSDQVASASEVELPLRAAVAMKHVALALALMASAVLFIEYRNAGDPAFCGVASGCYAVRISPYSRIGPVPLPDLALPAFAILFVVSLASRTAALHRVVAAAAGLGGLAAIALIAIQALAIGTFCKWCVIVDSSAIIAALASIGIAVLAGDSAALAERASVPRAGLFAWGAAGLLAVALPFLWAKFPVIPELPPEIAAEQAPGKVTIVSFTDFECPFCRKLHPFFDELAKKHPDKVRVVRKMKPLSGHPGALPAAKAFVCVAEASRDTAAHYLYSADGQQLTDKKLLAAADKLGVTDRDAFTACLASPATKEAIDREAAQFERLGGRGLPYTWVGGRAIIGANEPRLIEAVEAELSGSRLALPVWALFVLLGTAIAGAAAMTWLRMAGPQGDGSDRARAVPS